MTPSTELLCRLRAGHVNADLVTVGGCTHDGRCLSAADRIERLEREAKIAAAEIKRLRAKLATPWVELRPEDHGCLPAEIKCQRVLLAYPCGHTDMGYSDFEAWPTRHDGSRPTHWAPMPGHPKEEQER